MSGASPLLLCPYVRGRGMQITLAKSHWPFLKYQKTTPCSLHQGTEDTKVTEMLLILLPKTSLTDKCFAKP